MSRPDSQSAARECLLREAAGGTEVAGGVLCFGGEDWWYHNRAHVDMQLMRRFAAGGGRVLYVNSIVMRKWNVSEGGMFFTRLKRKLASIRRGLVEVEPSLWVYSPLTFPVHHVPGASAANQTGLTLQARLAMRKLGMTRPIVWVACPAASGAALGLPRTALAYQRTDRFEEYPGVDSEVIAEMDGTLKREADVTFFVNHAMYDDESADCRRAHLLDHGVDYEFFACADDDPFVPEDIKDLTGPIVGFFGGIDGHTFDVALAAEVVRLCPAYSFVFVGDASVDLSSFEGLSNAHFLGKKAYDKIPHYGKSFDVAIMPWRRNRWIELCNPIKLKEYLALGLPVVSTPFRELEYYKPNVYVAGDACEFAGAISRAIAEDSPSRRTRRRERVAEHTWESKAAEALEAVFSHMRASKIGV